LQAANSQYMSVTINKVTPTTPSAHLVSAQNYFFARTL